MPVRVADIPNLRNTAINAPRVNPRAAAAPAEAMGAIAEGIADVGQAFAGIAGQVNEAENVRQLSTTRSALDEARSKLFIDLQRETDPAAHIQRTDEFLQQQRQLVEDPELSHTVRARLMPYYDQWATSTRNQVAADAARLTTRRANLALENEALAAWEKNDAGRYETAWNDAVDSGLRLPEEREAAMREFQTKQTRDAEVRVIHDDPGAWLDENSAMPDDRDPGEWQNNQRLARQLLRQETAETVDQVQDMMASGRITKPEQLDELAGNLRPAALEALKADLERRNSVEFERQRRTPGFQQETIGRALELLDSYDPTANDFDAQFVEIDSLIRQLPPSAAKTELDRRANQIRSDELQAIDESHGFTRQQLKDAYKGGFFGGAPSPVDIRPFIDAGLLDDVKKLRTLGFSTKQAEEIADLTGTKKTAEFRRLWHQREEAGNALADTQIFKVAEAYAMRQTEIEARDPAAEAEARRKFGAATIRLEKWLKENPDATEDQKQDALFHIIGPDATDRFLDSVFQAAPGVLPPKPQE